MISLVRVKHIFYPDMPKDYIYELSARQATRGYNLNVITWSKNNRYATLRTPEGFFIHRLPGLNFSFANMIEEYPWIPSLPEMIESLNPDIVHVESHLFLTSLQAVRKAKKLKKPCVVTVHGVFADRGALINLLQFTYLRTVGLEIFKQADKVICLTKSDFEEIIKMGCPAEKIKIIPNAVDVNKFKPSNMREEKLLIWTGRFVLEKGVEYLVKAVKIVMNNDKYCRLLLIGYGPLKYKILRMIYRLNLQDRVKIVGPLTREEIAQILRRATIFVFPSIREGLPLAVLEALACGLPVVGSNVPGVRDVVINGYNGLLVPPKDPDALAKAIIQLLDDPELRNKLGRNARQIIIQRYSWDVVLPKIESVYYQAIHGR